MDSSVEALIMAAFAEHNIPVRSGYVESSLKDDEETRTWALEHLNHDTILSKEELAL